MKKLSYFLAAAAISGLAALATPSSASPLASGLATGNATVPHVDEGLVQNVHGWHCRWRRHHRHRRACYDDGYGYGGHYGGYGGYPFAFGFPFFAFNFYDDDDYGWRGYGGHRWRHGGHRKWRHGGHRRWKRHGGHRKWKRKHW